MGGRGWREWEGQDKGGSRDIRRRKTPADVFNAEFNATLHSPHLLASTSSLPRSAPVPFHPLDILFSFDNGVHGWRNRPHLAPPPAPLRQHSRGWVRGRPWAMYPSASGGVRGPGCTPAPTGGTIVLSIAIEREQQQRTQEHSTCTTVYALRHGDQRRCISWRDGGGDGVPPTRHVVPHFKASTVLKTICASAWPCNEHTPHPFSGAFHLCNFQSRAFANTSCFLALG